ncbi:MULTISPECIES: FIST signal transduction protein [unclassified Bradyrhizobium]|uniref:FIST signal transduction protein n=1 Tax=Bradyrhizobium sp. LLZ17 TaxID=3239388 RepID=A0AB39XR60_9BRAD
MKASVVSTEARDSATAGKYLAAEIRKSLSNKSPGALVVFAAPEHDHQAMLSAIRKQLPDTILVGASSAGEFTNVTSGQGLACALGLVGDDVMFSYSVGRNLAMDATAAAQEIVSRFTSTPPGGFPFRAALVLADALAGHADILVDQLTLATAGQYQFFGGGAGDNAQFQKTTVFCGEEVLSDAAVALEILSAKPLGVGVSHGWRPASRAYRVTASDGMKVISLDGFPAIEAFEEHAEETHQNLDRKEPLPFFLHNIIGVDSGAEHRLRVPLAVDEEGAVMCAAEVPVGSVVRIMRTSTASAVSAAKQAASAALDALGGPPAAALFFDCVATRLRMGDEFGLELSSLQERFSEIPLTGCNTHGQIARAEGQFSGFHNCTAVVCVFPE